MGTAACRLRAEDKRRTGRASRPVVHSSGDCYGWNGGGGQPTDAVGCLEEVIAVEWPGFSGLRPAASRYALMVPIKGIPASLELLVVVGFPGGGAGP